MYGLRVIEINKHSYIKVVILTFVETPKYNETILSLCILSLTSFVYCFINDDFSTTKTRQGTQTYC